MNYVSVTFDPSSLALVMHGLQLVAAQAANMHAQLAALAQEAAKPHDPQPESEDGKLA